MADAEMVRGGSMRNTRSPAAHSMTIRCPDPGGQLGEVEGLGLVVVGAMPRPSTRSVRLPAAVSIRIRFGDRPAASVLACVLTPATPGFPSKPEYSSNSVTPAASSSSAPPGDGTSVLYAHNEPGANVGGGGGHRNHDVHRMAGDVGGQQHDLGAGHANLLPDLLEPDP